MIHLLVSLALLACADAVSAAKSDTAHVFSFRSETIEADEDSSTFEDIVFGVFANAKDLVSETKQSKLYEKFKTKSYRAQNSKLGCG
ncbi:hypothetical protein PR003_g30138 [Phytophthora rubi]|uniref:RxLR effector protein n=1 Tax=Phytophthora rubi TaxID=129364 RepID=A0A6A4BLM3_9STRA|nr:hypothetical protein PR001_g28866 [Phytophthora rubi]KAE9272655.1 hypothetical protein PR003_g30138 [Phytophthora rubi]